MRPYRSSIAAARSASGSKSSGSRAEHRIRSISNTLHPQAGFSRHSPESRFSRSRTSWVTAKEPETSTEEITSRISPELSAGRSSKRSINHQAVNPGMHLKGYRHERRNIRQQHRYGIPEGFSDELNEINNNEDRTVVAGNSRKKIFSAYRCQLVILNRIQSRNPNMESERMDG